MQNYSKIMVMGLMAIIMGIGNGCASYMVYKGSEQKVITRTAYARGDQAAIRAIQMGDGGAGIGIDISKWEALKEQPLFQLGAAIIDAGLIYGGYKGIDAISNNDNDKDIQINVNGNDNNITINLNQGD